MIFEGDAGDFEMGRSVAFFGCFPGDVEGSGGSDLSALGSLLGELFGGDGFVEGTACADARRSEGFILPSRLLIFVYS
ncbi:MAG: hypothetical protein AAFN40_22620 [Cyanobacteria bacterium J06560_6]